jgi:hypothetical protein
MDRKMIGISSAEVNRIYTYYLLKISKACIFEH